MLPHKSLSVVELIDVFAGQADERARQVEAALCHQSSSVVKCLLNSAWGADAVRCCWGMAWNAPVKKAHGVHSKTEVLRVLRAA